MVQKYMFNAYLIMKLNNKKFCTLFTSAFIFTSFLTDLLI